MEIVDLPERPSKRQYQWAPIDLERLDKLAAFYPSLDEIDVLRLALCNQLSMLERDLPAWSTVPSEREERAAAKPAKSHKRSERAGKLTTTGSACLPAPGARRPIADGIEIGGAHLPTWLLADN